MNENIENLEKVETEERIQLSYLEDSIKDLNYVIEHEGEAQDMCELMLKVCRSFSDIEELEEYLINEYNQSNKLINNAIDRLKDLEIKLQQEKRVKELESQLAEAQQKNHSEE